MCITYYEGRYLWEDMFQELYLEFFKVKEETVLKFSENDKLHYLGGLIIRSMYAKRGQGKKHKDSSTSQLFETCSGRDISETLIYNDRNVVYDHIEEEYIIPTKLRVEPEEKPDFLETIDVDLKKALEDLYKEDWFLHDVLILTQKESLNNLSKRTKIDRRYLRTSVTKAKEYIKNHKAA